MLKFDRCALLEPSEIDGSPYEIFFNPHYPNQLDVQEMYGAIDDEVGEWAWVRLMEAIRDSEDGKFIGESNREADYSYLVVKEICEQ